MSHFDMLYGRRIKRRTGDDPARPVGLRPSQVVTDGLRAIDRDGVLDIPEIEQRAVPGAPSGRRAVRRQKTKA